MTDRETGMRGTNSHGSPSFLLSLQPPDLIQPGLSSSREGREGESSSDKEQDEARKAGRQ